MSQNTIKKIAPYICLALLGLFFSACELSQAEEDTRSDTQTDASERAIKKVKVVSPQELKLSVTIEDGVTLAPEEKGTVSSEITARLIKWHVAENDTVQKGDPIASLDPNDYQIQLEQAKAGLEALKEQYAGVSKDYQRLKSLVASESIPQQQFDSLDAQYQALRNQIEATENGIRFIKRKVDKSVVRAPFSGVITKKLVPLGHFIIIAMPGSGDIALIEKTDRLKVTMNISELFYDEVPANGKIEYFIPSLNRTVYGNITSKGQTINAMKQFTLISYVDNKKAELPAGLYAIARLQTEERLRTLVPPTAVKNLANRLGEVYSIKNGQVVATQVFLGFPFEQGIEVRGRLPQEIVKDVNNIRPGEQVEIIRETIEEPRS